MLRLRERKGEPEPDRDREGLRDTYFESVGDAVRSTRLRLLPLLGLLLLPSLALLTLLALLPLLLLLLLALFLPLSVLRLLSLPCSLLPSIASNRRLFLGPISPLSSNTSRLVRRGKMISHTLSSTRRLSTNSSMYVSEYPSTRSQSSFGERVSLRTHSTIPQLPVILQ